MTSKSAGYVIITRFTVQTFSAVGLSTNKKTLSHNSGQFQDYNLHQELDENKII